MPILDEDCYAISGEHSTEYLHVDCYEAYKNRSSKSRIDGEFLKIIKYLGGGQPSSTQDYIKEKWRESDATKYDNNRIRILKIDYEKNGPNGNMLNELMRNFPMHPNAIRIFIETIYKHPSFRTKGYAALESNKSPIIFDLMIIELIKVLLGNDDMTANRMLITMYELNKDKTSKLVEYLLGVKLMVPSNLYRNSIVYRLLDKAPLEIAFRVANNLPMSLEWDSSILIDRVLEMDMLNFEGQFEMLLKKYIDSPLMWVDVATQSCTLESTLKSAKLTGLIHLNTKEIIQTGRLVDYISAAPDVNWSERISDFIGLAGQSGFDLHDSFSLLKEQMESVGLWSELYNEALFESAEPGFYSVLKSNETIFDEM